MKNLRTDREEVKPSEEAGTNIRVDMDELSASARTHPSRRRCKSSISMFDKKMDRKALFLFPNQNSRWSTDQYPE